MNPREPTQEKGGGFLTCWDSYIGRYFRELGLSMHGLFFTWVWRIEILDFLVLVSCGGSVISSVLREREKERKEKQPDLWLHKFAVPARLVMCSSAYSTNFISTDLRIDHNVAFDAHPSYRPCKWQPLVNITNWSPSMKYRFSTFIEVWVCHSR